MPLTPDESLSPPPPPWVDPFNLGARLAFLEQKLYATQTDARETHAELDRLTRGLCSLLMHDAERYGRVSVPNVVRLLTGQPFPWEDQ